MLQSPSSLPLLPTAALIGFAAAGIALVGRGLADLAVASRLARTAPTRVADVPNERGPLAVTGEALVHDGTVAAPFSGTACLLCEWTVEEGRRDEHGRSWEEIAAGVRGVPFRVDDGASVLVVPDGADLRLANEAAVEVPGGQQPPERIQRFIDVDADVGPEDAGIDFLRLRIAIGDDRRYREARLDPGEPVSVYGTPTYAPGTGREVGQVSAQFESGDRPFLIADGSDDDAVRRIAREAAVPLLVGLLCLAVGALVGLATF